MQETINYVLKGVRNLFQGYFTGIKSSEIGVHVTSAQELVSIVLANITIIRGQGSQKLTYAAVLRVRNCLIFIDGNIYNSISGINNNFK